MGCGKKSVVRVAQRVIFVIIYQPKNMFHAFNIEYVLYKRPLIVIVAP